MPDASNGRTSAKFNIAPLTVAAGMSGRIASDAAGVQATAGASGMMIRGDWRDFRDDPPTSGPYFLAAAVLVAAWMVVLTILLAALMMRFL